ncbi:Panacea domain-containing protein [Ignavigranum ruoffiae]|nr:type II toxin-antitoxin system antitoxin SocA domain-containing protein [Ignavigranum ruoffiae]
MIKHFVLIYSSSLTNRRLAFKISSSKAIRSKDLPTTITDDVSLYGFTTHRIFTEDTSIQSIYEKDMFFEEIEWFERYEDFLSEVKIIQRAELPKSLDISRYILSKVSLDKLEIQKILYLIYSRCLEIGIKVSDQAPVAYKYGPVFEDVYKEFIGYKKKEKIHCDFSLEDRMKLMKTTINPKVLDVIDKIIETTKKLNGGNLIDITHVIGGPWDKVYQEGANNEIDDQTILKYNYKVMNCLTES